MISPTATDAPPPRCDGRGARGPDLRADNPRERDVEPMLNIAGDFPLLAAANERSRLVYVDNAATTQKPQRVIDAVAFWYSNYNANPHRGSNKLSAIATDAYEQSRGIVAAHIGAEPGEVVFCRNATEAINIVACSFGPTVLRKGDDIVVSIAEHHSNLLPWQQLARELGCNLVYLLLDENGRIPTAEIERKITEKAKVVSIAQVSNALGTRFPVELVVQRAHAVGAYVMADCAQGLLHCGVNVRELGVDFAALSAHKALGPDGVGVLWGRRALLDSMPPFLRGGETVDTASRRTARFKKPPLRFEAGTQNASGAYAFAIAVKYLEALGLDAIRAHEAALTARLLDGMRKLPFLTVYGNRRPARDRCGIVSFNCKGQSPLLVSRYLDQNGITVRAGSLCAQPLLSYLNTAAVCRISLAPYNTADDVDYILEKLSGGSEMIAQTLLSF